MSTMELIYKGRVKKIGKNTAIIRIPAEIADLLGGRPGMAFEMHKEGDRLIIVFPGKGKVKEF